VVIIVTSQIHIGSQVSQNMVNKKQTQRIQIGKPIESMNPIFMRAPDEKIYGEIITTHGGRTLAEIKQDGYRLQIHKKDGIVRAFTRSLNEVNLGIFPELNSSLVGLPDCILDTEVTGYGLIGYDGFQSIKKRFRNKVSSESLKKYLESSLTSEFPVGLTAFDTLYWEDKKLINLPLIERRKFTEGILEPRINPSVQRSFTEASKLEDWFVELTDSKYEGLVCKNPNSLYLPGKETTEWLKLKRAETLDLAILGVYLDGDSISQVLCGTYNQVEGRFETLAKVNAKREGANKSLDKLLDGKLCEVKPANLFLNPTIEKHQDQIPTYFIKPENSAVLEVASMNCHYGNNTWHSCGYDGTNAYSLRIAWLKRIREDKGIADVSTTEKVRKMYSAFGGQNE
jgi:ATP-dependent DNA ligase